VTLPAHVLPTRGPPARPLPIRKLPIRKLIGPALMSAVMFLVLIGLGTWQVRRLAWKEAILAQIARAEAAPPIPLPATPDAAIPKPFTKIVVTGTLLHDKSALYGAEVRDTRAGPDLGALLIEPLQRDGAPPLLVDRGWVPLKRTAPVAMRQGTVTIAGYVHPADTPGLFSVQDDVVGRHFYTLDPAAIGAALGLGRVAPFILIALGPPTSPGALPGAPTDLPIPAEHLPRPPNNHLQYAITWYGLAAALLVIFAVWARKAGSE
jgi:surfeit locus 1 family protein